MDAVELYRKVLSEQPDKSVWIASIGFTTNIEGLMRSGPDQYSPLNGTALLSQKVAGIGWMGGKYPSSAGAPEWNFSHDNIGGSTKFCVDNMPTDLEIMFSGFELGVQVLTGAPMTKQLPETSPCRKAYIDLVGENNDRPSWDPVTTLYAVQGVQPWWNDTSLGYNNVTSCNGNNDWVSDGVDHSQAYLTTLEAPSQVADVINQLLLQPPKAKQVKQQVMKKQAKNEE